MITILLFSGCAGKNIANVRSDPSKALHIVLNQNYQQTYKNLSTKYQECMMQGWAGVFAQMHIDRQLYSDLKEGHIIHYMTNMGMKSYYVVIDIKETDNKKTLLDAYIFYSTWENVLPKIEEWSINTDSTCDTNH